MTDISRLSAAGASSIYPPGYGEWLRDKALAGQLNDVWMEAPQHEWFCWSATILRPQAVCIVVRRLILELCQEILGKEAKDLEAAKAMAQRSEQTAARMIQPLINIFTLGDIFWALALIAGLYEDVRLKTSAAAWQIVAEAIREEAKGIGTIDRLRKSKLGDFYSGALMHCAVMGHDDRSLLQLGDVNWKFWVACEIYPEVVRQWARKVLSSQGYDLEDANSPSQWVRSYQSGEWETLLAALAISEAQKNKTSYDKERTDLIDGVLRMVVILVTGGDNYDDYI